MVLRYDIQGLDCAHCAANLESEIAEIEGVVSASVSFMTLKLEIEFEDDKKDAVLEKHADWVDELKEIYEFTAENVEDILHKEIGIVFMKVLEHAGVYKATPEGRAAFLKFIETI